jgi:methionyl-tRNA formyltransferase
MRLVFLGTPAFAVNSLDALVKAGHEVLAVFTQPDRPRGRGGAVTASPVKACALSLGLPVIQPERIRHPEAVAALRAVKPDAMAVVGYGQIIPQAVIDIAPLGIINVHASLLPKYRGAAPVQWAIARGEQVTGVTTMRIDAGLDTGDILLARETAIGVDENAIELGARLSLMGAELLIETLDGLASGTIIPRKQNASEATFAPILRREDGLLDWNLSALEVYNRVRGFLPWPGAYTSFRGNRLNVWCARVAAPPAELKPGAMLAKERRLFAGCGGSTVVELLEVQLEGRKRLGAGEFLLGQRLACNEVLGDKQ